MITIEREFRRSHLVQEEALVGMTFTGEDGGHKFLVHVKEPSGAAVVLGGSVVGKFVRADGVTVELTAAEDYAGIENGAAWVILAANCYTQAGPFRLTVTNIAADETRNTVCAFTGYVRTSETDAIVDPENVINVDAIVGMIDEMEDATEAAQEAASFVNSIVASSYSTSLMYSVGDYCTYSGAMYRCTTATDGAFNPAHWEAVKVGSEFQRVDGDVDDLKSAIDPLMDSDNALIADYQCIGYYYNSGAKQIKSSANLETFKYNIPDDCVAVRIQSNFYASQIMLSNTDTTSATFPSMSISLNEIALRPATAPGSATNVDITYIINDDNRYKYLYVPHYVANTNPVVVTATLRGEISSLTYGKIDAAGRYRRSVPTGEDIFTSAGFTSGYILSNGQGGTTANPDYGYTDYIDVEGKSFTLDGISGAGFSVVYDENENPLGSGAISLFFDKNDRPDGTKYIRFNVYLANLPSVKMNVYETEWITYITPSQVVGGYTDVSVGTGKQFTSVVEAVEYANSIASDYNTVNVYIYPGTYDIIGDYDLSEQVSSWNGLTLADHVNLIGVGSPDKIVLSGELPTDISSYAFDRNNVSTLNFWKNNSIKNLTITAKNMRYCLHNEDGKVYAVENAVETIENCVFIYYENDTGIISSRVPIGIGAAAGRKTTFRNCVFDNQSANGNYPLLLHNNTNAVKYCEWIFESCDFIGGTMNSLKLSSAGSGQTEIVNIIGCRLPHNLRFDRQNVYTGTVCEYKVFGHGNAISGTASWDGVTESASVTEMLID